MDHKAKEPPAPKITNWESWRAWQVQQTPTFEALVRNKVDIFSALATEQSPTELRSRTIKDELVTAFLDTPLTPGSRYKLGEFFADTAVKTVSAIALTKTAHTFHDRLHDTAISLGTRLNIQDPHISEAMGFRNGSHELEPAKQNHASLLHAAIAASAHLLDGTDPASERARRAIKSTLFDFSRSGVGQRSGTAVETTDKTADQTERLLRVVTAAMLPTQHAEQLETIIREEVVPAAKAVANQEPNGNAALWRATKKLVDLGQDVVIDPSFGSINAKVLHKYGLTETGLAPVGLSKTITGAVARVMQAQGIDREDSPLVAKAAQEPERTLSAHLNRIGITKLERLAEQRALVQLAESYLPDKAEKAKEAAVETVQRRQIEPSSAQAYSNMVIDAQIRELSWMIGVSLQGAKQKGEQPYAKLAKAIVNYPKAEQGQSAPAFAR